MAAITDHQAFPQPADSNGIIWRYMDVPKLVDLLHRSELHMAQLRSLEDPLEGRYTATYRAAYDSHVRQLMKNKDLQFSIAERSETFMRASLYVNCWCLQDHETQGMWRVYGGAAGVALRTTYSRLVSALPPDVYVGQVRYVSPDHMLYDGNALQLAMIKRHFFRDERECRVVKWQIQKKLDGEHGFDMDFDRYPAGLGLHVNLSDLVTDIVVSPLAPAWFHTCVTAIVDRFAPGLQVARSSMRT